MRQIYIFKGKFFGVDTSLVARVYYLDSLPEGYHEWAEKVKLLMEVGDTNRCSTYGLRIVNPEDYMRALETSLNMLDPIMWQSRSYGSMRPDIDFNGYHAFIFVRGALQTISEGTDPEFRAFALDMAHRRKAQYSRIDPNWDKHELLL